ncbi:MAG: hypothetical protein A2081_05465 [Elusimicrobia bacterium GWC2_61_19]|nr:MAG: hypothetical protein A2081_05465 [Elusimicrobia bacterium GWC2_61_19]
MPKKDLFRTLLVKSVKTLIVLFTLFAMGWFVEQLPFAQALPFFSAKLPVSVFLNAVVSFLAVAAFVKFGAESAPAVDGLLDFMAGAGELFGNIVKILSLLFSYYAFQAAIFPFISGFEWVYQSFFLGFTLFFLARAGLQIYGASEGLSRFLLGVLHPDSREVTLQK